MGNNLNQIIKKFSNIINIKKNEIYFLFNIMLINLSYENASIISSFLSIKDLLVLALVNKQFHNYFYKNMISWRSIISRNPLKFPLAADTISE